MNKYYRVKKGTFLWEKGAILKNVNKGNEGGYVPVSDIWDTTEYNKNEYISTRNIENNPDYFERVYKTKMLTKFGYKLKEEMKEIMANDVK